MLNINYQEELIEKQNITFPFKKIFDKIILELKFFAKDILLKKLEKNVKIIFHKSHNDLDKLVFYYLI